MSYKECERGWGDGGEEEVGEERRGEEGAEKRERRGEGRGQRKERGWEGEAERGMCSRLQTGRKNPTML